MAQRLKRRKFVVQNSRFLLLTEPGRCPNLACVCGTCGEIVACIPRAGTAP